MRHQKISHSAYKKVGNKGIGAIQAEANRTQEMHEQGRDFKGSPDIDWQRTNKNDRVIHSEDWDKTIHDKIDEYGVKTRPDSVLCFISIYTTSHDFWETATKEEQEKYKQACFDFHVKNYCQGDKNRIVDFVWHYDEQTPHAHVCTVPIVKKENGKMALSADKVFGNRKKMSDLQQAFEDEVCKQFGFEHRKLKSNNLAIEHVETMDYKLQQKKAEEQELQESIKQLDIEKQKAEFVEKALKGVKGIEPLEGKSAMFGNVSVKAETLKKHNAELEGIITRADFEELKNILSEPEKIKYLEQELKELNAENIKLVGKINEGADMWNHLVDYLQQKEPNVITRYLAFKEQEQKRQEQARQERNKKPRRSREQER